MEKYELVAKTFGAQKLVPESVLKDLPIGSEVQTYWNPMFRGMVVELRSHIWGREIKTLDIEIPVRIGYSYKVPSSWWQYFKLEHFPGWLLDRFPVKYEHFQEEQRVVARDKLKVSALYPECNLALPDMGRPVLYVEGVHVPGCVFDSLEGKTMGPRSSED